MPMNSGSIADTRVYAQDAEPEDRRDGILWVNTSKNPPVTNVRDADAGTWEAVAPGNVTIGETAPTGKTKGHLWIDTTDTKPVAKVLDGNDVWNRQVPVSTQTERKSGEVTTKSATGVNGFTATYSTGLFYDGAEITITEGGYDFIEGQAVVIDNDGNTVYSEPFTVNQGETLTITPNFSLTRLSEIQAEPDDPDTYSQSADFTFDTFNPSVPEHSHQL
jgi:hypothetical protein